MTSMALAMGRRGNRHVRSLQLGAMAGIAACLFGLLAFALLSAKGTDRGGSDLTARQTAVTTWEAAVHPMLATGGEVVARGPRTAVAALTQHTAADADIHAKATGWVRDLSQLRRQIAAVSTPSSLRAAHDLLDTAMAGYVAASQDLLDAAIATGERRAALLSDATTAGKSADSKYDEAMAAIAAVRAELDLTTDWSGS